MTGKTRHSQCVSPGMPRFLVFSVQVNRFQESLHILLGTVLQRISGCEEISTAGCHDLQMLFDLLSDAFRRAVPHSIYREAAHETGHISQFFFRKL